ncbi:aspartate aminotransferase family protein (plasmid) [Pseudomonas sp. MPC6]|nr:aspartate aminotransferase family protein [Pseudomonas sp. MPC6]
MLKQQALRKAHDHLIPGRINTFSQMGIDLVIGRREGYRFWDIDGKEFMDFHLNGGTYNVGHRNPEVLEVLNQALTTLDIGNHHFASPYRTKLAEQLSHLSPGGSLHYSVLTSSGSEANDVAIKSARYATGRRKIVALDTAFHGRTGLSGAAGDPSNSRYFHSDCADDFHTVPFNDLAAMDAALASEDVAAVLMEVIPATAGFTMPTNDYLPGVKALCERYGSLFIADEVQVGLGRCGELWAVQCWGVEPDILVTGKGLSAGLYPIAAAVMSERVGSWLIDNGWGHVSTFGGSEIGCAVASKVLAICSDFATLVQTRSTADYLRTGLADIQQRHPYLKEIRSQGVVMGLKFDSPNGGIHMMKALFDQGLWAIFAGFDPSVLQFKAGLLIDRAFCDEALDKFEAAIRVAERVEDKGIPMSINPSK